MNKRKIPVIGVWIALIIGVYFIFQLSTFFFSQTPEIEYSEFVRAIKSEEVATINVEGNTINFTSKDGIKGRVVIPSLDTMQNDIGKEINEQMTKGKLQQKAHESSISWVAISNILSTVIIIAFMIFFLGRRGSGGGFTKSAAKLVDERNGITNTIHQRRWLTT